MERLPTARSLAQPSFFKFMINDFRKKLRLPPAFVKNFCGNVPQKFILKSLTKSDYSVSVKISKGELFLCDDEWCTFVKDHDLEFGEVLVFKYIGNSELTVTILSGNACEKELALIEATEVHETGNISKLHDQILHQTVTEKPNAISLMPESSKLREEIHSFTVILGRSNKYNMPIPRWLVMETGLIKKSKATLLDPCGRSFDVKIIHRRDGVTRLAKGWYDCCIANDANPGDTCSFQSVEGNNSTIRVDFCRKSPIAEQNLTTGCFDSRLVATRERERIIAAAEFTSDYPFFSITLRSPYEHMDPYLVLPRGFAKEHLKDAPASVTLRVANGVKWHAKYSVGAHHKLIAGWKAFVFNNQLQEGDVCIFELVQRNPIELKVSIIRRP